MSNERELDIWYINNNSSVKLFINFVFSKTHRFIQNVKTQQIE